jgi:nuclear transcription Y subunit beta
MQDTDHLFPIANVARIMKDSLPPSAKIAKNAKELTQEAVSEFTAFVTSEGLN